ncbi:MAG: lipooligosaccharide transport system permease protein [Actinomycetota bacterium]|jgi:lipooligosaccharide transport system permease protein|nr:lipooligosaccharide transport system permease protein [Actinomycetota bacterium]
MATPPLTRVLEREARVWRHFWRSTVVFNFINPLMFLAALGLGLGGLVERSTGKVDGLPYLSFIAPGLMAAGALQASALNSLWPMMAGIKWMGTFQAMVASPISPSAVYGGEVLWNVARSTLGAVMFLAAAALLGGIPSPWGVLAVPAAALCALSVAAPLTAWAAMQETDVPFSVVARLGIVPIFLFSGTFFPVKQLPSGVRPVVVLSPLWHGVELCRAATTGRWDPGPQALHVAVLVALAAAGWQWGTRTFTQRLTP